MGGGKIDYRFINANNKSSQSEGTAAANVRYAANVGPAALFAAPLWRTPPCVPRKRESI